MVDPKMLGQKMQIHVRIKETASQNEIRVLCGHGLILEATNFENKTYHVSGEAVSRFFDKRTIEVLMSDCEDIPV